MKILLVAAAGLGLLAFTAPEAQAIGCVSGAAVGGVAGHYAGHHGLLGAAAGCAVGHHAANVRARQQQSAAPAAPNTDQGRTN